MGYFILWPLKKGGLPQCFWEGTTSQASGFPSPRKVTRPLLGMGGSFQHAQAPGCLTAHGGRCSSRAPCRPASRDCHVPLSATEKLNLSR